MGRHLSLGLCIAAAVAVASCDRTSASPSSTSSTAASGESTALQPRVTVTPTTNVTIAFGALTTNNAAVSTYSESGFTLTASGSNWIAWTGYGHPAPAVVFKSDAGKTEVGQLEIGGPVGFAFKSIDLYSSTTTIPYTITGMADGKVAFVLEGEVPHTFGNFMTVTNPNASTVVDKLIIKLTDASFACCGNPMGVDNVALVR
jgi:hypothetical protein